MNVSKSPFPLEITKSMVSDLLNNTDVIKSWLSFLLAFPIINEKLDTDIWF